jgi:hypothetical protein
MQYLYLFLAWVSLVGLFVLFVLAFADTITFKTEYFIYAFLCISFVFPILYLALKFIFSLLMLWYYILGVALILLGIITLLKPNVKTYNKILIIILIVVILYIYYDYRSILEINFDVEIRQKRYY